MSFSSLNKGDKSQQKNYKELVEEEKMLNSQLRKLASSSLDKVRIPEINRSSKGLKPNQSLPRANYGSVDISKAKLSYDKLHHQPYIANSKGKNFFTLRLVWFSKFTRKRLPLCEIG